MGLMTGVCALLIYKCTCINFFSLSLSLFLFLLHKYRISVSNTQGTSMSVRLTVYRHRPLVPSVFQSLITMSNLLFFPYPIPYFVNFMLIQMNVCFVYLGYKLASQIVYAQALSLGTLCIQTTFLYCTRICLHRQYYCFVTVQL